MTIKNVNKAVRDYKQLNAGGRYSPLYGKLMLDLSSEEVWCV